MKLQVVILTVLIAYAYANPLPSEEESVKESALTTELPAATENEPAATTLANEKAELKVLAEETKKDVEQVVVIFFCLFFFTIY